MSAPTHRDELEELEAARKAACACLDLYSRILSEARFSVGSRHVTPAIEKCFRESFGLPWPPPDDPTPSDLLKQIHDLIEVLNPGWDAILKVDETLILVTSGLVSAAGVTSTSVCRLAGELAISLWTTIRNTDPQLDPNLHAREPDDPSGSPHLRFTYCPRTQGEGPGRFDLREELFRGLEEAFQTRLVHMPQIRAHRLRTKVEIEIARGRDHVRMRREAVQTSSLEIPPIPGADSAPILSLNGPPATTPSSQETSEEPPKPLSLGGQILRLKPRVNLLARLADLMGPREEALTEELRKEVYSLGDDDESEKSEKSLKRLVYRTDDVLRELEYPRRLQYTAHRVFWKPT